MDTVFNEVHPLKAQSLIVFTLPGIKTEMREIDGHVFQYTYSDAGLKIERDGKLYNDAYDPTEMDRIYIETNTPIETMEPTDEEYAEAGKILLGVRE